jgi:hypothetical protein
MLLRTLDQLLAEVRLARRREGLFCAQRVVSLTAELAFLAALLLQPLLRSVRPLERRHEHRCVPRLPSLGS